MRISRSKIEIDSSTVETSIETTGGSKRNCPTCNVAVHKALSTCPNDGTVIETPAAFKRSFAGKYQFVAEIGSGGMGVIYKAKQPLLDRYYAIKMLNVRKANQQTLARFHQEAKAASALNHPNVISVHDFGFTEDDDPYMVMDFVDGMSLSTLLQTSGAIPYLEAVGLFVQIADGMNHAHTLGVLHRDLKPSNVMLTKPESLTMEVKIVDFGIAKINKAEGNCSLTQTGDVFGSPLYMSPEQASGKKVDPRSDIYSLGCLMYEALTGKPPLQADTIIQTMFLQLNSAPASLSETTGGRNFPDALEYVVKRCLEKDPDQRYQSMLDLKKDLLKVAGERSIRSSRSDIGTRVMKTFWSIKWLQIAVALAVFFGAVLTIIERLEMQAKVDRQEEEARTTEQKFTTDLRGLDKQPLGGIDGEVFAVQEVALGKSEIDFPAMSADDGALMYLQGNRKIVSLSMRTNEITPQGFTHLQLPNLQKLDLQDTEVSKELVTAIVELPRLTSLSLARTRFQRTDLERISKLKNLRSLDLTRSSLNDSDCQVLAQMSGLEQLKIGENPQISDNGVRALLSLKHLRSLDLNATSITNKSIAMLRGLTELNELRLYETHVSDEACKYLVKMPLQKLYLSDTFIGCHSIRPLSKMTSLVYLEIDRNPRIPAPMQLYLEEKLSHQGAVVRIDRAFSGETQPPAKLKCRPGE
jgi:tRNA A-37 threonylcarbamoyl transferase component Bud32